MRRGSSSSRKARLWVGLAGALLLCAIAVPALAAKSGRPSLSISVLSGRADLVSGGSALVAIDLPRSDTARVKVTLGRRNVTKQFAVAKAGQLEGLLTGLALGQNVLEAALPSGWATRIILVNHPTGGPLFSGPQLKPWICEAGATDNRCDQPPKFTYAYMSTNPAVRGFQPYDISSPPSDVAQTTTDQGVAVPFIVRTETGYMDRDQYQISVLYQPGKPWTRGRAPAPVRSQAADSPRGRMRGRPSDRHRSGDNG